MALSLLISLIFIVGAFAGLNTKKRQEIEDIILGFEFAAIDFVNGDISQQDLEDFLNENLADDILVEFGSFQINGLSNFIPFYIDELDNNDNLSSIIGNLYFTSTASKSATVRNIDLVSQQRGETFQQFQSQNEWEFDVEKSKSSSSSSSKIKMVRYSTNIFFPFVPN